MQVKISMERLNRSIKLLNNKLEKASQQRSMIKNNPDSTKTNIWIDTVLKKYLESNVEEVLSM